MVQTKNRTVSALGASPFARREWIITLRTLFSFISQANPNQSITYSPFSVPCVLQISGKKILTESNSPFVIILCTYWILLFVAGFIFKWRVMHQTNCNDCWVLSCSDVNLLLKLSNKIEWTESIVMLTAEIFYILRTLNFFVINMNVLSTLPYCVYCFFVHIV